MYRTRPRTSNGKPTRKNASRTTPAGNPARISVGRGQFFCHVLARVTYYASYACVRPPVCGPQHDSASRYYPNEHESKNFKIDLRETLTTATFPWTTSAMLQLFFVTEQSRSGFKVTVCLLLFQQSFIIKPSSFRFTLLHTHTHTHTYSHTIGLGSVRASILNLRDIVLWNVRASILSQKFCIQFVSKLIIFLPDLDQPIFTCPRA